MRHDQVRIGILIISFALPTVSSAGNVANAPRNLFDRASIASHSNVVSNSASTMSGFSQEQHTYVQKLLLNRGLQKERSLEALMGVHGQWNDADFPRVLPSLPSKKVSREAFSETRAVSRDGGDAAVFSVQYTTDRLPGSYRQERDAYFEYSKRITDKPNYKYCEMNGMTEYGALHHCEQLMARIDNLQMHARRCADAREWKCVVAAVNKLFQDRAYKSEPRGEMLFQRGRALLALGKVSESISDLRSALKLIPGNRQIQSALDEAERAEQTPHTVKRDIRGFSPGERKQEVIGRIKALANYECRGQNYRYPCYHFGYSRATVRFDESEYLHFNFTENLPENLLRSVEFYGMGLKPYKQLLETIIAQFNLYRAAYEESQSSNGWRLWQLGDGLELYFIGDKLELRNPSLVELDKKAYDEKIKNSPNPKF